MIEENRPIHTEVMLENFYKQLIAAAEHLQNVQVKAQSKLNTESPPPRVSSGTSIWEPRLPDSVLRIPDAPATAEVNVVKSQGSPISVSQIIGHSTTLCEVKKNETTLDKQARVYVDYSICNKPFRNERKGKGLSPKSQSSLDQSSASSSGSFINKESSFNASKSVPKTILKLCSRHAEIVKREHFMPGNGIGFQGKYKHPTRKDTHNRDEKDKKISILKFEVVDNTIKSNTDYNAVYRGGRITRPHTHHIDSTPISSRNLPEMSSRSPSIDGQKLRTHSKSGQRRNNSVSSKYGNAEFSLKGNNTYHVQVGNPCSKS